MTEAELAVRMAQIRQELVPAHTVEDDFQHVLACPSGIADPIEQLRAVYMSHNLKEAVSSAPSSLCSHDLTAWDA